MACLVADFGAWALLPPAIAILAAVLTRRVYQSLLMGILVAAIMVAGAGFTGSNALLPFVAVAGGMFQTIQWIIYGIATPGHAGVVAFTLFLGGFVAVMQRAGAIRGFGEAAMKYAHDRRMGQGMAWFFGAAFLAIDDYFHVIAAGSVFRPITDKLRVSREKLAYLIDSTAAPMVIMMPISTWVGVIIGIVAGVAAVQDAGLNAFSLFLSAIPYNFYAILTVIFVGLIAFLPMEYGPMRKAEHRAMKEGKLLADGAKPLMSREVSEMDLALGAKPLARNLILPMLFLFASAITTLYLTGKGIEGNSFGAALRNSSSELSLAVASFLTLLFTMVLYGLQGSLKQDDYIDTVITGFKAMVPALALLALAWAIGLAVGPTQSAVLADDPDAAAHLGGVGLGAYLSAAVEGAQDSTNALVSWLTDASSLPLLAFLLSAVIAFATGTSFGTFAIMIPVTLTVAAATPGGESWFGAVLASTLGGAVFGDHCSPISDTTVMSSMAGQCDHIDHVRTQLPYALTVAGIGSTGYLVLAFTEQIWIAWAVNAILLATVVIVASFLGHAADRRMELVEQQASGQPESS